jgi:hypothetical protein
VPPSPTEFICASLVDGAATTYFFHRHKRDRYQYLFLLAGAVCPLLLGAWFNLDARGAIMEFMPWTVLLALICSAACHRLTGRDESVADVGSAGLGKLAGEKVSWIV